jgi:hypothetical protein
MLAADHYPDLHLDVAISNRQLFEIHHSKISLTRAKKGYAYPTIRLPFAFSRLIGLSTRIYQTVHDGALAFLVVVSSGSVGVSSPNKCENSFSRHDARRLHTAEVAGSNPTEPIVLLGCFDEITGSGKLLTVN